MWTHTQKQNNREWNVYLGLPIIKNKIHHFRKRIPQIKRNYIVINGFLFFILTKVISIWNTGETTLPFWEFQSAFPNLKQLCHRQQCILSKFATMQFISFEWIHTNTHVHTIVFESVKWKSAISVQSILGWQYMCYK